MTLMGTEHAFRAAREAHHALRDTGATRVTVEIKGLFHDDEPTYEVRATAHLWPRPTEERAREILEGLRFAGFERDEAQGTVWVSGTAVLFGVPVEATLFIDPQS